jgi:hypothetical protein
MVDREARERIQALEAQGVERDCEIARLSGRLSRLEATLEAIRTKAPGAGMPAAGPPPPTSAVSSAAASQSPAQFASLDEIKIYEHATDFNNHWGVVTIGAPSSNHHMIFVL